MQLSVIMPALNEERAIEEAVESAIEAFRTHGVTGEVVVVNDGSTDRTGSIVSSLAGRHGERVRLLEHERPMGMGRSFWDGVGAAKGDAVVLLPGDNENYPGEIIKYVPLLKDVDIVVPFVSNREVRPFSRNLISAAFRMIINATFGTSFRYTNGTVLYRRQVLSEVACSSDGFFFQAELLVKCVRRGSSFTEVPYRIKEREGGASKAIALKSLTKVCRDYIRLVRDVYFTERRYA